MAETERLELNGDAWAEVTVDLNSKAFGIAKDSVMDHGRIKSEATNGMILASVTSWSFGEKVDLRTLEYEVKATPYLELLEHVHRLLIKIGSGDIGIDEADEKKD